MTRFGLVITIGYSSLFTVATTAAPPVKQSRDIHAALQAEADGNRDTRWKFLNAILKSDSANREARWQLGYVQHEQKWLDAETSAIHISRQAAVQKYRAIRNDYPLTYRDQLKLANWCRSNHLPVRERAHLTAALERSPNPNDAVLRRRLGFRRINGAWVSQRDLAAQKQVQKETQKNLRKWRARITRLARQLDSTRRDVRKQAAADFKAISDPTAIPALEEAFANGGLQQSQQLVEVLAGMKSHQAADALARLAVLSPWDVVRKEASVKLRTRPVESFAPELLATLRTPIASRTSLYVGRGGVQLVQVAISETAKTRQVAVGRSTTIINRVRGRSETRTANEVTTQSVLRAREGTRNMIALNGPIKEWNDRVCAVLSDASGVVLPADPTQWWEWWNNYNQMESEDKPYEYRYDNETHVETLYAPPRTCECLVAGTPIWTDRGFVAVEKIEIGDLVLSRNAKTGELSYEPVLRTTVREAEPVMTAVTDRGTIRGTGGHTFWISGQGWTKLRDIKPGDYFHGAAGPSKMLRLKKSGTEKTYNLVVSDVHTYFVGKGLVLSHDITFAEPVDATVPGLPFEFANNARRTSSR